MVINLRWQQAPVTLSVKPNCLTVSIEAAGGTSVYSYDYAGRLWTALVDLVSYRRGLDGKMVAKWGSGEQRQRRWLQQEEALQVETQARQVIAGLVEGLAAGAVQPPVLLPAQAQRGFQAVLEFNEMRSRQDAARYLQVYRPVGILPPDQYMAVVLQATEGCSFNTCTFCTFYRDRQFRIRPVDEFLAHARAVKEFIGAGMSLRRTIFLGDANALVVPLPRLAPLMEAVHQVYDVEQLGGMYAFLDGFSAEKKSAGDYRRLAELGLKRIYVGLESGDDALLHFLKKPGRAADAVSAVRAMKEGGVPVGVIVLLGAGGQAYARSHVDRTVRALNEMRLDMDDLIYFSELVTDEGMEYSRQAYQAQLKPLTPIERLAQGEAIETRLRFSASGGVPHISRYDVREFVY
jgi:hypothetical protein